MFAGGYFAATTVDSDRFHVNLLLDRSAMRHRQGSWDEFVDSHLQQVPVFAERLRGAVRDEAWRGIGPLAFTTRAQALPGAALVGDACGYIDPLTGEGIYFALFTARRLAAALDAALVDPKREASAMRRYQAERRREVAPRMFLAKLLQRGMRQDWIARTVLGVLANCPQLTDLLVTLTGDAAHPRDLLRPSFWRTLRLTEVPA
jgi:flavin-dependent dehydrogenase